MVNYWVLKLIVVFLITIKYGNGCSCIETTRQEVFEKSDFVSRVKILSKNPSVGGTNLVYNVEHIQVFKPKSSTQKLDNQIFTPIFDSACGVTNLQIGQEYLLAGHSSGLKSKINACNAISEKNPGYGNSLGALKWELVNEKLLKQLENGNFNE